MTSVKKACRPRCVLIAVVILASQFRAPVGGHSMNIPQSQVQNTTELLNFLLDGYDKRLRPGFRDDPVQVEVNLNIRSMGPISELDMAFQMDCYFRQSWVDRRLSYSHSTLKRLQVSVATLERLWKPDTYFHNGKKSNLHTITMPNKFLRISPNGKILYSMRLTIKAGCPMWLQNFPMDTQSCPLLLGSHGYDTSDVVYVWTNASENPAIQIYSDMTLSQFDLVGMAHSNKTIRRPNGRHYSALQADFILRRHTGYFMINFYIPISLLVIISWVGFWINREATADRISLGVTTVLTMTFVGGDNRHDLPKVSYSTALDYFVAVCFAFVLATIIQFAAVHFYTKRDSGEPEEASDTDEEEDTAGENVGDDSEAETSATSFQSNKAASIIRPSSWHEAGFKSIRRLNGSDVIGARHAHSAACSYPPDSLIVSQRPLSVTAARIATEQANVELCINNIRRNTSTFGDTRRQFNAVNRRRSISRNNRTASSCTVEDIEQPEVDEERQCGGNRAIAGLWNCLVGDGAYYRATEIADGNRGTAARGALNEKFVARGEQAKSKLTTGSNRKSPAIATTSSDSAVAVNSVSQLDKLARFLFPLLFLAFHVFYWTLYASSYTSYQTALTGVQTHST